MPATAPLPPEAIKIGDWSYEFLALQATCACGRVAEVHRGELIRSYGSELCINAQMMAAISRRLVCIRCHARGPKLEIVSTRP